LAKQFSKEEIAYYYFARSANGWNRMKEPKPEFEKYISQSLKKNETESKWLDFDFSLENMKNIHKKLFGDEFNENNSNFFKDVVSPIKSDSRINEVARSCGNIRNEYMVNEIQKYWSTGYSIYIHYGAGHAAMQKPAIENFVRKTLLPS
jgi:hydrogenase maturation factor HypF (carbamoyltransferase family)